MSSLFILITLVLVPNDVSNSRVSRSLHKIITHEDVEINYHNNNSTKSWFQDGQLHLRIKRINLPKWNPRELLDYHNQVRSNEGAANMIKLEWDDNVAVNSKKWSSRCNFNHPEYVGRILGQNLHFTSGSLLYTNYVSGLEDWYNEKKDYDYNSGNCKSVCAHYTTMVRWDYIQVGCSIVHCPSLYAFQRYVENAAYLSCEYYSEINEWTEKPYIKGEACSRCPLSHPSCDNKLCTGPKSSYPLWDPSKMPTTDGAELPSIKIHLLLVVLITSYLRIR